MKKRGSIIVTLIADHSRGSFNMTNIKRRTALGLMTAATGSLYFSKANAQEKKRIACIYTNAPNEAAWDYEHARGLQQARDVYGDRIQIDDHFNVRGFGNGEDVKLRELANSGYDMIIAASVGYMKATIEVAFEAPDTKFEHCGGYIRGNNLATYMPRWYEGRSVTGMLAGAMTKTNRIGYLASFPVPQVVRGINSAYLAAKSVNPDVEFEVLWLSSWASAEKEEAAARDLISRGADVLMQHVNTTKAMEVAEEKGVYAIGQATDMKSAGPNAVLTSVVNNWGPYYVRRIGELLDGTWKSEDTWGGLGTDMISLAELSDAIPNRVHLQVKDAIERLREGKTHPFMGPVRKQDGAGWLAPGEAAKDSDLNTMNFYVEGITSVFPSKE